MKEALLYDKLDDGKVKCGLCAHRCTIAVGRRGRCGVRLNDSGTLVSMVYGKLISANIDPIEKKPIFHYKPGSLTYSIATAGCNFRCKHCQNYDISQWPHDHPKSDALPGRDFTPDEVINAALASRAKSISYTYTEPTIAMEFYLETVKLAHEQGLGNVFVSNGYMTPESARLIAPHLDANNIDLKGDDRFYKEICYAGSAAPVKETIKIMKDMGVWVEVTTLVIEGHNDSDECLEDIARFIASVDTFMPWHVTGFYPAYKLLNSPPTSSRTLNRARKIGFSQGLKYVYEGNRPGAGGENTYCHSCGELLIERIGFSIKHNHMVQKDKCRSCSTTLMGRW